MQRHGPEQIQTADGIKRFMRPAGVACQTADEQKLKRVRVLLAGMSNMLADIVTAVLAQIPGMLVAGAIGEGEDIAAGIRHTRPDALVIQASDPGNSNNFLSLLRQFPNLKIVAIAGGVSEGFLHELRPHSVRLPELSAEALQTALPVAPAPKPR